MGEQETVYDYEALKSAMERARETAQKLRDAARVDPDYLTTQITM